MTTKVVSDEQIGHFARRMHDLQTRMVRGAVGFQPVMEGLQWLIEGRTVEPIREHLPYEDEQSFNCSYGYPDDFRILSFSEQLKILLKFFPNLDRGHFHDLVKKELPKDAEGWAVIPKPEKIGENYHQALEKALKLLSKTRSFEISEKDKLTEKYLHLYEETARAHAKLNKQPGDYWFFPFQFGKKWAGHSFRNAQARFTVGEFGLGPYEEAILLLTHPNRITGKGKLHLFIGLKELHLCCAAYYEDYVNCPPSDYREKRDFWLHFDWEWDYQRLLLRAYYPNEFSRWGVASGFLI